MFTTFLYAGDVPSIEIVADILLGGLVLCVAAAIMIGLYMLISSKIFPPDEEQSD